jgi:hypothetical protein
VPELHFVSSAKVHFESVASFDVVTDAIGTGAVFTGSAASSASGDVLTESSNSGDASGGIDFDATDDGNDQSYDWIDDSYREWWVPTAGRSHAGTRSSGSESVPPRSSATCAEQP